jgi:hypothetical protein
VTLGRELFIALLLPGLAGASEPSLLNLVMPDARVVCEIDVASILASPAGQAIQDQLAKVQPQVPSPIPVSPADIARYVQAAVIAVGVGPGKDPPTLVIVRGSLDAAHLGPMKAFNGGVTEFEGVRLMESAKDGNSLIAFLDGGITLFGSPAEVKAAIRRWRQGVVPPPALLQKLNDYGARYDVWVATFGTLPAMPVQLSGAPKKVDLLEHLAAFSGGARFSPDFDLTVEIVGRTEKDAEAISDVMHMVRGVIRAAGKESHMENLKLESDGKRFLLSLHVPEKDVLAALQQRKTAAAAAPAPVVPLRKVPAEVPASGAPALGTIRVQSSPSDMGTVVLPTK